MNYLYLCSFKYSVGVVQWWGCVGGGLTNLATRS